VENPELTEKYKANDFFEGCQCTVAFFTILKKVFLGCQGQSNPDSEDADAMKEGGNEKKSKVPKLVANILQKPADIRVY
jgi:hypothetical protein